MSSVSTELKREGVAQAWSIWIRSATGEAPYIDRHANGVNISWKPGQAAKMEQYLSNAMKPSEPDPDALNVNVPLTPVILPLALKKSIGYIAAYTALIAIGTKLIWK